jgi:hypothetical protein
MKDIQKIKEFFSKPLKENTFKIGDKVTYLGHPAEITKVNKEMTGAITYNVSYDKGNGKTKATNIYNKDGEIKSLNEGNKEYFKPSIRKDKSNPNFLYVDIAYPAGSDVLSIGGSKTMGGQDREAGAAKALSMGNMIAKKLQSKYNIEDIDVKDLKNGKVEVFAVSDDFIKMASPSIDDETKSTIPTKMSYYPHGLKYQSALYKEAEEEETGVDMAKKQLDALGVKYEMSKTDKVRPFKVIYRPINKSDKFYDEFEDIVDLFNLKGFVKSSMSESLTAGYPHRKTSGEGFEKIVITEPMDDATRERMIRRFEAEGWDAKPNFGGGITAVKKTLMNEDFAKFDTLKMAINQHEKGEPYYDKTRLINIFNQLDNPDQERAKKEYSEYFGKSVNESNGFKSGKEFINIKLQKYPKAVAKINQLIDMIGEDKFTMEMAMWIIDFFNNASYESPVNEAKSISDYKVGDVISFKDGEDWKVMKVKDNVGKLVIKPYNEKAKKGNVSLEIDIDADYLKNNLSEATKDEETEFHKKLDKLVHNTFGKRKGELEEAYVPSNIKDFAKRKGISSLVNKVAGWAEKVGKRITGGTAIGYNYSTLILDMEYQGSEIRINTDNDTIELYDEPVYSFNDFKQVYLDNQDIEENVAPNHDGKAAPYGSGYKPLEEKIAEALDKINEELCPAGKAYIKRRQAAGEKSSAYLSGRGVKVCKGQMSGKAKKKK